jgi:hypothetical protein
MKPYKTDIRPVAMNIPVYMAYVLDEGHPKIVKGEMNCTLNLGNLEGERPLDGYDKPVPSPSWGIVELQKLHLPDKTGLHHRPIFSGYVPHYASFVAPYDYDIIKQTESVLLDFVKALREEGENRIPILFATEFEAEEFLKDEENYKLAQAATKHYDKATEAEFRALRAENTAPPTQPQVRTLEFGNPYVGGGANAEESPTKLNIKNPGDKKKDKPSGGGLTEIPGIPS